MKGFCVTPANFLILPQSFYVVLFECVWEIKKKNQVTATHIKLFLLSIYQKVAYRGDIVTNFVMP